MSEENTTETVDQADTEIVEATDQTPTVDVEALQKALKKANAEAAERRKQLKAYEQAEKERRDAEMSEAEKLKARIAEMETRAQQAEARIDRIQKEQAFFLAASKAELTWASEQARQDAVALLDLSELDEDDIESAVKGLKKSRPYLFASHQMPDIDGTKRGSTKPRKEGELSEEDVEAAARKYGVSYKPDQQ